MGLTEMQFVLLIGLGWLVESKPGGVSQKDLAQACGCSTALASQVLKNLVQKRLVTIRSDERDARARVVALSAEGETALGRAVEILESTDKEFRSDDPEVFDDLYAALHRAIAVKMRTSATPERDFGAMPLDEGMEAEQKDLASPAPAVRGRRRKV